MLNAYWEPLTFELPPARSAGGTPWRRWIDTALPSPQDISAWEEAPIVSGLSYTVGSRSIVFLIEINTHPQYVGTSDNRQTASHKGRGRN
jgi:isoamylase